MWLDECGPALSHLSPTKSWPPSHLTTSGALLLKQMAKKQTGFVLLIKQNKSDLVFHHWN